MSTITIAPGDYVAVSDITCEAIHAAVVKCFEAAGFTVRNPNHVIVEPKDNYDVLGAWGDELTLAYRDNAKRQLTLQQLFTATNSIRWPDWAVDIRFNPEATVCYFTGDGDKFQNLGQSSYDYDSTQYNNEVILATRSTVSDAELRPVPELGWYDWSADKPRELPPVGERVQYSPITPDGRQAIITGEWYTGVIIAYHDDYVWTSDKGIRQLSNTQFRPSFYNQRKADLERDRIITAAEKVIKTTSSAIDNVALTALYDAGLLRGPTV